MKKQIALMLVLMILFTGCVFEPPGYPFPYKDLEIVSVEFFHNRNKEGYGIDEENFYLLRTLMPEEYDPFMEKLYALEMKERIGGPLYGYGPFFVRVMYANGYVEYFGSGNIESIATGEEWNNIPIGATNNHQSGFSNYYFVGDGFLRLFAEYVDISELIKDTVYYFKYWVN